MCSGSLRLLSTVAFKPARSRMPDRKLNLVNILLKLNKPLQTPGITFVCMARVWKGDLEKQFLDDMEAQDIHEDGLEAVSQRSYEYTLKYTPVILIGFSRLK